MNRAPLSYGLFLLLIASTGLSLPVLAATNSWLEQTMADLEAMDFEFTRGVTDLPFLPVAYLSLKQYGETEFQRASGAGFDPSFRTQSAGTYAMLPVHIGDHGFAVAVPYIGYTRFDPVDAAFDAQDVAVYRLALGVAYQTERDTQVGGFVMPSYYAPLDEGDGTASVMGAVVGRRLVGERTVWYYGLFYDHGFSDGYFLPYLGLTYIYSPSLSFSLLAPWPAVSYAPSRHFYLRVGVGPSGASWALNEKGRDSEVVSSLGGWDLGAWAGWKLGKSLWLSVGAGYSGLRSLAFDTDGDTDFAVNLDKEPWVSVALEIRPE